jgi:hypothetical protein
MLGAATWMRDELVKRNPSESVKHVIDYIPQLTVYQWGFGAAVIVLVAVLETSFQRKQEVAGLHAKEVGGLDGRIAGLESTIQRMEERLTRSGMEIDRPAFKLKRTIPPLVGALS